MDARTTALSALIACRKQGAWADGVLKEYIVRDRLDRRDAALATRLCYGVLQNRILLDHMIDIYLTGSIKKLQPVVLDILRLGMYQIMLMDKIPVSAAVNQAVEQGKKYANRSAAGLINGVLRHACRERGSFAPPGNLSVRYSHPEDLVSLLRQSVGDDALEPLLASHNKTPETVIQLNSLYKTEEEICTSLQQAGVCLTPHPWLPHARYLSGAGSIEHLQAFRDGDFFVQDSAARLAVLAAQLEPGMQVMDCCASPGGKSFSAALSMHNCGTVISCDIHPHKIDLIRKGAERLHLDVIHPTLQDASLFNPQWEAAMDAVIADVPCSGLGVIRKKPDIRYKDLAGLTRLPEVQLRILNNQARYVKSGGVLLYSTCTILMRENEAVIQKFLEHNPTFHLETLPLPEILSEEPVSMITLLPSVHGTDGFFICKLRRDT